MAVEAQREEPEPLRRLCPGCGVPVLDVHGPRGMLVAEVVEWEPRAACQSCAFTRAAHPDRPVSCARCGNSGYVGRKRPPGPMVAIDLAWADEYHVRLIGEKTDRREGEALHEIHVCYHQ